MRPASPTRSEFAVAVLASWWSEESREGDEKVGSGDTFFSTTSSFRPVKNRGSDEHDEDVDLGDNQSLTDIDLGNKTPNGSSIALPHASFDLLDDDRALNPEAIERNEKHPDQS